MYTLHLESTLYNIVKMTESTSTIILYILFGKIFLRKWGFFWLEIFHALSQPMQGIRKIKKIPLDYFSDTMNGYEKDRQ